MDIKINSTTAVRIMCYDIFERNPEIKGFIVTPDIVNSLLFCLEARKYDTIMYTFGYKFLLEILKMFEEVENFEECNEIKKQIELHNVELIDNIPTK